jgi:hypothetical protein
MLTATAFTPHCERFPSARFDRLTCSVRSERLFYSQFIAMGLYRLVLFPQHKLFSAS